VENGVRGSETMFVKGDRVILQKDVVNIKYGDVVTIAELSLGDNVLVRAGSDYVAVNVSAVRRATVDDLKGADNQNIVNPNYKNGQLYMLGGSSNIGDIIVGDVGIIVGVEVDLNEQNDLFSFDFGSTLLKFNKSFVDSHMNYYDIDYHNSLGEEIGGEVVTNKVSRVQHIEVDDTKFELVDNLYIAINEKIEFYKIGEYIDKLKKLQEFLINNK
jgi:hypothetical protein